ncbi:cupin domain-containing protein [Xenorhabdus bovienii]|uniref:cupin domain-containing protein n=1 Tax=Xenorhabdus bovienii TaxID=40576 RepID=UPI0023B2C330|nr:cupin domain-containing protein [Xenorhabdus bovienii]MDE9447621.1 cupin domain-containing protein [Xenorhabdus bovienii]
MNPVINLKNLTLKPWKQGEHYEGSDISFGQQLDLKHLGIAYNEVPKGKSSCPFHNHHSVDELFFILEGNGTYRFGSDEFPIEKGDVVGAPAGGQETAHQIINTGSGPLRYLAMSANVSADVIEYPDSGKFQSVLKQQDGKLFHFVGRLSSEVDYWDGEPGA